MSDAESFECSRQGVADKLSCGVSQKLPKSWLPRGPTPSACTLRTFFNTPYRSIGYSTVKYVTIIGITKTGRLRLAVPMLPPALLECIISAYLSLIATSIGTLRPPRLFHKVETSPNSYRITEVTIRGSHRTYESCFEAH